MPSQSAEDYFTQFAGAGPATQQSASLPTPASQAAEDYFSKFVQDPAMTGTGVPPDTATPSSLRYIFGKALTGAGNMARALTAGQPQEAGILPGDEESRAALAAVTPQTVNRAVFGSPNVQAPNAPARYAGAVAEAVGGNPALSAAMPVATAGGALGGQLGLDSGLPGGGAVGGLLGGGLTSAAAAGTKALLGMNTIRAAAKSLGSSETLQQAGGKLQSAAQDWLDRVFPAKETAAWAPLDAKMYKAGMPEGPGIPASLYPPSGRVAGDLPPAQGELPLTPSVPGSTRTIPAPVKVTIPEQLAFGEHPALPGIPASPGTPSGPAMALDSFLEKFKSLATGEQAGAMAPTIAPVQPAAVGRLTNGLQKAGLIDNDLNPTGQKIPWDDARYFSSWLGGQIKRPGAELSSLGDNNLKALYKSLMDDQEFAANEAGAGKEFQDGLDASTKLRSLREQRIAPLAEPGTDPEKAAGMALKGSNAGGSQLQDLRSELPSATDELAAAHLLQTPKGWTKLAPEAKQALVPNQVARTRIDSAVAAQLPEGTLVNPLHTIIGMGTGGPAAVIANALFPHMSEWTAGAAGELAGVALPQVARAGKYLVKNPGALTGPAVGAVTGNALTN